MTRLALILIAAALLTTLCLAAFPPEVTTATYRQVTVGNAAVTLGTIGAEPPPQTPALGRVVMLSVHDADVRVRFDGVDPTPSTGHLIPRGSFMVWTFGTARKARFIRAGDADATVAISEALL